MTKFYIMLSLRKAAEVLNASLQFILAALLAVLLTPLSGNAAPEGVLGWRWDGKYYATATEACRAQWEWAGMNNGKSRFIGAFDEPDYLFSKDCKWTSYQYLAPQETGCGVFSCGTVLPSITSFSCASGYTRVFPYDCVKAADFRPQRPVCGYGGGGKRNPSVGNPIILSSGTKYHSVEDFSTADGKLSISRTYRSNPIGRNLSAHYLPLGLPSGWQFNFAMELQLGTFSGSPSSPNGNVTLIAPDGSAYDFKLSSDGSWAINASLGATSTDYSVEYIGTLPSDLSAVKKSASEWRITGPDDRQWTLRAFAGVNSTTLFDVARPTAVEHRSGYAWTYNYDANDHRLLSIVDTHGRTVSFAWSYFYVTRLTGVAGSLPYPEAISEITFPDGTKATYVYDPAPASAAPSTGKIERLTAVQWRDSGDVVVDSEEYHYENADFPYALTGITDHRGTRVATYAYDGRGRAISTSHAAGSDTHTVEYGTSGTVDTRRVTNPLGKSATYRFSHVGSSTFDIQLAGVDGEASTNCVASNTSFTYDSNGYVATETDEEGRVTSYVRDSKGRPTQITEASGTADARTTTIVWHSTYNVPNSIVRPGLTTAYDYNAAGQLTSKTETDTTNHTVPYPTAGQSRTWTYTYTTGGLIATVDGPLPGTGDVVSYTYDASGYVATFTNEVGHIFTVLARNGRGLPTKIQGPNGIVEDLDYDARGRLVSDAMDPAGINARTLIEYDDAGNVAKFTEPNGSFIEFEYDGNNRVTKLTNGLGETMGYTYDPMGNVTLTETRDGSERSFFKEQHAFDELGRLLQVVKAGSATWAYGYDKVGNLLSVTDPNNNATVSTYDRLNRVVRFVNERSNATTWSYGDNDGPISTTDPNSVTTSYVRNGWNEVIQEQSNDIGALVYERNQRGDVVTRTDGRNVVTQYAYDNAGRLISVSYPSETASNVTLTYDSVAFGSAGIGKLTNVSDAAGTLVRQYDLLGRVAAETRTLGNRTYTTSFAWDSAGKLSTLTYPSGDQVHYDRDQDGNIWRVRAQPAGAGWTTDIASWIHYAPFGQRDGISHANGLMDWRDFDEDRRVTNIALSDTSVSPAQYLVNRGYRYWDNRNLTFVGDWLDNSRNETYGYTANGYLEQATGPWGNLSFYYDAGGNRTHRLLNVGGSNIVDWFGYVANSNRIQQVVTNGVQSRAFASDAAGNLIGDTDLAANQSKGFGYDSEGRLGTVTRSGALQGEYKYDYLSRLATRTLPEQTLHYVHDLDGNIIAEYDGNGSLLTEYIWLDGRPLALVNDAATPSPTIYHVHTDHLERPVMMTDATKNVVWQATYLPFGEAYTIVGSATLDQRFPGQWFQLESGLHYNWHRHYDPSTGRYLQPDPLGMPDGPSRWTYVTNSPLMETDPSGLTKKGRKSPTAWCVNCDAPHGGLFGPYCPDCYKKSLDPDGCIPPLKYPPPYFEDD